MSERPPSQPSVAFVLLGLALLGVATVVGITAIDQLTRQQPGATNMLTAAAVGGIARLILGASLVLLGYRAQHEPAVRGGALIGGAILLATVAGGH